MRKLAFLVFPFLVFGCLEDTTDDSAEDSGTCGTQTCTSEQICLYRACTEAEMCQPATTSCPDGTIPADCNGTPGCQLTTCPPVVQGCVDIPTSCSGDVTCACDSICGSAADCQMVDGTNAYCGAM